MKNLFIAFGTFAAALSSFAQGTLIFNNRTQVGDKPITLFSGAGFGTLPGATAQLVLVTGPGGAIETPLTPTTPFRTGNAAAFFTEISAFVVDGVQPGESANFRIRVWSGAPSFEAARVTPSSVWGQSAVFIVDKLGGTPPGGGLPVLAPSLINFRPFTIPEPSTMALGLLALTAFVFLRKR